MNFKEFRLLSEATKELYAAIGKAPTDKLLKTKVDPVVSKLHDHVFGKGNHHIEIPLENDLPEKVKSHIEANGDSVDGDNVKLKSGRSAPISKYLAKANAPKDVQDEHQNWSKNKSGNSKLVITRHAAEVASASTGTHWSSCARATKKSSKENVPAWDAMPDELHNGTLMAMHVHKDAVPDKHGNYESKDILGRSLIKRHEAHIDSENPHEVSFHRENKKYGAFPDAANKAVDNFTEKNYPQKNLVAHKTHTLYDDDDTPVKVNTNHPDIKHVFDPKHDVELSKKDQMHVLSERSKPSQEILDTAADSRHSDVRHLVAKNSTNPETIRKVFNNPDNGRPLSHHPTETAAKNPHAPKDVVDAAMKHSDSSVRTAVMNNHNLTHEQIMTGLHDKDTWVISAAAAHPKLDKTHVDHIINNPDKFEKGTAQRSAYKSTHATHEQINKGLNHENQIVAMATLDNPNIDKHNLIHAFDSPHMSIRKDVLSHPKVDHDVLAKAVLHSNALVHATALSHPKMTPELFALAKTHPDAKMASHVVNYEKEHNDKLERIKQTAIARGGAHVPLGR